MDNPTPPLRTLACPTCGAPLELDGNQPSIHCKYCNASVVNPEYQPPQPARPEPVLRVQPAPSRARLSRQEKRSGMGFLVFFFLSVVGIPIAIVLILVHPFSSGGGSILPQLEPIFPGQIVGTVWMLPGGATPEVIAEVNDPVKSQYTLQRLDMVSHKSLWSALGQTNYLQISALLTGDTFAYAVIKNRLVAIRLSDGKQAWEASLPDILSGGCARCALLQNGQVIVHTTDDSLGAYDAMTGHQTWEKRLENPGNTLYSVGDAIAVAYWADKGASLGVFDAASGNERLHIEPTCQPGKSLKDEMEVYSDVVVDSAASPAKAYIFFGLFNACVQRWDLTTGKMDWETAEEDQNLDNSREAPLLMTGDRLIYVQEDQLRSIDAATGKVSKLLEGVKDYSLVPLLAQGQRLVIRAKRTRGTTSFELWGYDLSAGQILWKRPFPNSAPIDPPDEKIGLITTDESGWTYQLTPAGLWLIRFQTQPNQVDLAQVNLDTGVWTNQKSLDLGVGADTDFYDIPKRIAVQDHLAWFALLDRIYAIDTGAGSFSYRWP
jgi:outer membrane protein assembly factor BamB